MRSKFLFGLLLVCIVSACQHDESMLLNRLNNLHASRDYFRMKRFFEKHVDELSEEYQLYYQCLLNSYFNKSQLSNNEIDSLMKIRPASMTDSLISAVISVKVSNHVRLSEYRQAADACKLLIDNYFMYYDSLDQQDIRNGYVFWKALADIPKQKMILSDDPEFQLTTDNRGFWNVDVQLADTIAPFIFDTGAGTSLIKKSVALQSGYPIIQLEMPVKAFTGRDVETNLAIAEKITIGGVSFDHVIFLVVEDEHLNIPNKSIAVSGIIGFPVIAGMKEFSVKNGTLRVKTDDAGVVTKPETENLSIHHLAPIVEVNFEQDTMQMKFDTGATRTNFYTQFFNKYQAEIESRMTKKTIQAGSVGGTMIFDVFKSDTLRLSVDGVEGKVWNASIYPKEIKAVNRYFYGNLGQDYITSFNELEVSFKNAHVGFR